MIQIEVSLSSNNDMLSKSSKINIFYNLHTQIECLKVKNWNEKIAGENSTTTKKNNRRQASKSSRYCSVTFLCLPFTLTGIHFNCWSKQNMEKRWNWVKQPTFVYSESYRYVLISTKEANECYGEILYNESPTFVQLSRIHQCVR